MLPKSVPDHPKIDGGAGTQDVNLAPGSPWGNGYAESFHRHLRRAYLALEIMENLPLPRS
ncbi:integrase core domain-containing protein [Rubinisphaera margarita]|uniref:integrase core domain-containing protein n=1 Tax=Rubinisphaera margarita TaxID=2909586 RepID=UPI0036F3ECFF